MMGASKRDRGSHSNATPDDSSIGGYHQYGGGPTASSRDHGGHQPPQHLYPGTSSTSYVAPGSSKHKSSSIQPEYSHGHGGSSKRTSKNSTSGQNQVHASSGTARESSSHTGGDRKQHSTKIANALKKYINEIE